MLIARFSNLLSRPRWLATRTTRVHGFLLRRTRGRLASRNYFFGPRQRVLALTTIGRRSGSRRTTALGYLRDGDDFAVVAYEFGARQPTCVVAEPDRPTRKRRSTWRANACPSGAVEATREEHERLWPRFVDQFAGFEEYRQFTTRKIPVIMLEHRAPEADQPRS